MSSRPSSPPPAPVVPQKRKSPPATSPPLSPIAVQSVERESPPQFEKTGTLDALGHGEPHVPHSSNSSQRQPRDDDPFRPLVPDDTIKNINAEAFYIGAQQVRAMLQPYCQCGEFTPALYIKREGKDSIANFNILDNGSSRADGVDFDAVRKELCDEMEWLTLTRRKSQREHHGPQTGTDELIEPKFSLGTNEWPRPSYRDYSDLGELNLQSLLAGKSVSNLSVQQAEKSWRAQVPEDNEIKIHRDYNIAGIYMELASLKAITKDGTRLNLCLAPDFVPKIPKFCTLTDDIKPHRCKTTTLLKLDDGHIHLVFPKLGVDPSSQASNELEDYEQRHLFDEYILPALRQVLPKEYIGKWPHSFDAALARASEYVFNLHSWDIESDHQEIEPLYELQSEWLEPFWDEFQHRIAHPDCRYNGVKLLFLDKCLKWDMFSQDLVEVIRQLRKHFAPFDWTHIPYDRCWVNFWMGDVIRLLETGPRTTLLYRADCLAHLEHSGCYDSPWVGFTTRKYAQYLMRDVGSIDMVREDDDVNAAPSSHSFTRQFRAYNQHKIALLSDPPSRQDKFRRLLFDYYRDAELSNASSNGHNQSHTYHADHPTTFESVLHYWDYKNSAVRKDLQFMDTRDFGAWREIPINPHILLALLKEGIVSKSGPPGPTRCLEPPDGSGHSPFFAVSTSELNHFLLANSTRFIFAIHHMASCAWRGGGAQNLIPKPSHTQQLSMMRLNRVLVDLLVYSLSSVDCAMEPWLFDSQLSAHSPDHADDTSRMEQGLGVQRTMDERGMAFLDSFAVDLILPSSSPAADANIAWPPSCDFSEPRAEPQAETRAGRLVVTKSSKAEFQTLTPKSIGALYRRVAKHGLGAERAIPQGTISQAEFWQLLMVHLAGTYFLPKVIDQFIKVHKMGMEDNSAFKDNLIYLLQYFGIDPTEASADSTQVLCHFHSFRTMIAEHSERVSHLLACVCRLVAYTPSTMPASQQHMPPAADSNNSTVEVIRKARQEDTADLLSKVTGQHQQTRTGSKPEEDSTELTTYQSKRRRTINSSPDTGFSDRSFSWINIIQSFSRED